MKLLTYNWVQTDRDEKEMKHLKAVADNAAPVLELLTQWAQREEKDLDSLLKLANIKDKPNRGELALIASAQREILQKLIQLLDNSDTGE